MSKMENISVEEIRKLIYTTKYGKRVLDLSGGYRLSKVPKAVTDLTEVDEVHILNLSGNHLTELPTSISKLKTLEVLRLNNNQLSELPETIGELINLTRLSVMNNQLSVLPANITCLKKLTWLYLNSNWLTILPGDMGQMEMLEELDVSDNQLTILPDGMGQMEMLTHLYVNNNQLTILPGDMGQMEMLEILYVSNNQLTILPDGMGQMKMLEWLDVSNNQLTILPDGMGQMKNLVWLDVDDNPLTVEAVRRVLKLKEKMKDQFYMDYISADHVREQRAEGQRAQVAYKLALRDGYVNVHRARILLIGQDRAGKTSLKKSLLGLPFDPEEPSTEGIEVDPSKCEIEVKQVKNWHSTDENKPGLLECSKDIARMIAEKLCNTMELEESEVTTSKEEDYAEPSVEELSEELSFENTDTENVDLEDEDGNVSHMMQVEENVDHLNKSDISSPTRKAKEAIKQERNGERSPDCRSENTPDEPYEMINATSPPDDITKHVHQLLQYARGKRVKSGITKEESVVSIDMWDFAGQHLYYASHPVFLSSRAVYVLVHNLSKRLNAPAQPCVRQGTNDVKLENPNDETNMENLLSWLATIHSVKPMNEETDDSAQTKLPYLRPPVFIVGTHADKPVEDIAEMKKQIQESISGKEYEMHVVRPFFSIDNTARSLRSRIKRFFRKGPQGREHQAEQEDNADGIQALQNKIMEVLKQEPYMGEKIPVRWFLFEKVIEALVAKQIYHRNLQQLQNYAKNECFMEDAEEFVNMISFYHGLGMIIKHRSTVVLKAQWLIDLFKQLITIPRFNKADSVHAKYWKELEENGILSMEHIDHVFSRFIQQGIIKEDILDMMERFGLIAKFAPSPADVKYFVPAQLTSSPESICKMEPSPTDPCPLYLFFVHGFVPHGLFSLLVSRSIRWCCESWPRKHPTLYQNGAWFVIGKQIHDFILICKTRFIKIVLRQRTQSQQVSREKSAELATHVREFVERTLQDLSQELPYLGGLQYEFCVACPYCHQETEEVGQVCSNHGKISCTHEKCFHLLDIKQDLICMRKPCDKVLTVRGLGKWLLKGTSQQAFDERNGKPFTSEDGTAVKQGTPSDYDLEALSNSISTSWMNLGRRLKITQAKLDEIDARWPGLAEKAYRMLLCWKQENGSKATYQVLDKEVPDKEQASIVGSKRQGPNQDMQSTVPANMARSGTAVKEGTPSDDDLEALSNSISTSWMNLGRRLKISQAKLDEIDARWPGLAEKARRMLSCWKQENGSTANYRVLSDALCHEFVNRKDLAEGICFHQEKLTEPASSMVTSDGSRNL